MRVERDDWTLDVGDRWHVADEPECLTLDDGNRGALQFSSATRKSGLVDGAEIRGVAERMNRGWGDPVAVAHGEFCGLLYRHADADGIAWRRWFLGNGRTLLFVTYNTSGRIAAEDERRIDDILRTLRARPG